MIVTDTFLMKKIICLLPLFFCFWVNAQESNTINPKLLQQQWSASWITCPDVPQRDYGVYHFRKNFQIENIPANFIIHISGDNRYRLFINGKAVCSGPARGDLYNWYFETIDIAKYIQKGNNTIAAIVWNMGIHAPVAQISNQTSFVVQGDTDAEKIVNTNDGWKVLQNLSYNPCSTDNASRLRTYMVIGPGDEVDAAKYPWGWEQNNYADTLKWLKPKKIANPVPVGYGSDNLWTLTPRNIPLMQEKFQRIPVVRRTTGIKVSNDFLLGQSLQVPAHSNVSLLFDQTYNTVAYPEMVVSGGKGSSVKLTYAEALYDKNMVKGNRNEIEGKELIGNYDIFKPDGGQQRVFRPLWLRTYRYIKLEIITDNEPLVINDLYGSATGYPFEVKASFKSNDASLQQIWDIGWRTAQLCAGETYYDCPYYEQLQYEGDTRIQSLISLYVTGDDRLMRKAILDFYHSRVPEGLTQGRYPSSRLQVIPPFSLYWVSMLYDYMMHRKDKDFLKNFLVPVTGVLDWYEKHIDKNKKMLGPMKWWNFVDWNDAFPGGTPDGADKGNSSIITLQYALTLKQAAIIFENFGKLNEAKHYRQLADELIQGTYQQCFDQKKFAMANTPLKNSFSQHAGIMAILTGALPTESRKKLMQNILNDTSLSQATFYYRFYLNRALKMVGMADNYYAELKPWRGMIANGLTTFAENPDPTRSDCHAWSSSPNYDFFATICGIVPSKPGFAAVRIEPAMGELQQVTASMPHPDGMISVSLQRKGTNGIEANITLPNNLIGEFIWKGKTLKLKGGEQLLKL